MSIVTRERATAFAPASVGNVAIGFDIMGFAVEALGDRVTVTRSTRTGVQIGAVRGVAGDLPHEARDNTAGRALLERHPECDVVYGERCLEWTAADQRQPGRSK